MAARTYQILPRKGYAASRSRLCAVVFIVPLSRAAQQCEGQADGFSRRFIRSADHSGPAAFFAFVKAKGLPGGDGPAWSRSTAYARVVSPLAAQQNASVSQSHPRRRITPAHIDKRPDSARTPQPANENRVTIGTAYCTVMTAVLWVDVPLYIATMGRSPAGALAGTTRLIW
jgi:hypothetical protein